MMDLLHPGAPWGLEETAREWVRQKPLFDPVS
jgi:hypothetical protein